MKVTQKDGDFPFEQAVIQTSALQNFVDCAGLLIETSGHIPMMGMAVGDPGVGKSASLQYYRELLARKETPTRAISLCISPCSTPNSLIVQLFDALGEPQSARQKMSKLDDFAAAAYLHNLRLVALDEAGRLNDQCLDLLCSFFDMTGCPCLLIGLPTLLRRCQRHAQFWSRVGMCMKFKPLSFEEVLCRVLPALQFPGWEFDPRRETDSLIAEQLWEEVSPSLRGLRTVLGIASVLAHKQREPRITESCIQQALHWLPSSLDRVDGRKRSAKRRYVDTGDWHRSIDLHE